MKIHVYPRIIGDKALFLVKNRFTIPLINKQKLA